MQSKGWAVPAAGHGPVTAKPLSIAAVITVLALVGVYLVCVAEDVEFYFFLVAFSTVVAVTAILEFEASLVYIPLTLTNPYTLAETGTRLHLSELVLLIIFSVWFLRLLFLEERQYLDRRFLIPAVLVILAAMASYMVARFPMETVRQTIRYVEVMLVFFVMMTNSARDEERIKRMVLYLIVGGLLASFVGIGQFLTGEMAKGETRRIFGWHGGGYGALIGATIVLSVVGLLRERRRGIRFWSLVTLPFAGVVIVLAQTRAWIGSLAIVLIFLLFRPRREVIVRLLVTLAIGVAAVFVIVETEAFGMVDKRVIEGALQRSFRFVGSQRNFQLEDLSIFMRANIWLLGVRLFLEHPLTGIGVGSLRIADYFTGRLGTLEEGMGYVDNQYLQFFAEGGIVAGIAWIAYITAGVVAGIQALRVSRGTRLHAAALGLFGSYLIFVIGSFFWVITPHHELFALMVLYTALLVNIRRVLAPKAEAP